MSSIKDEPTHVATVKQERAGSECPRPSRVNAGSPEQVITNSPSKRGVARSPCREIESPPRSISHVPNESGGRDRSPQPANASAARRIAAIEMGEMLACDVSPYALCPDDPNQIRGMVIEAAAIRDEGIPIGTAKADEVGFKAVKDFCRSIGTPWMRPRTVTEGEKEREALFFAMALIAVVCSMKPGARNMAKGITGCT